MLELNNFYLVGVKGVGMTALACCLKDMGKQVVGSDVSANFVTQPTLDQLNIQVDHGFDVELPATIQAVIFSGANGGSLNPQVQQAATRGLPIFSHAQALAALFNSKSGIAVSGVGGKSSISAMLAFVTAQLAPQSYAVGVGQILGLAQTGQYLPSSEFFIAEADEYIEDPADMSTKNTLIRRFSFLNPQIIICSNLKFDHPDVYQDFTQTQAVYLNFFQNLRLNGTLIYHGDDQPLTALAQQLQLLRPDIKLISYGEASTLDYSLATIQPQLAIPGRFNQKNALAALAAAELIGLDRSAILASLSQYRSVKRRFEFIGERQGVLLWDDYAHHPSEIQAAIKALQEFYPDKRLVVAFQSHTFSRTKELFDQFIDALATNQEIILIDIFPSAREEFDPTINSDLIVQALKQKYPQVQAQNLHTIEALKTYLHSQLKPGDVFLTLGAGDIYQVYD